MSPLLWIIYYDPLFAKIEKIKQEKKISYELDYNDQCINITDLAYMDDSTWIGKKKEELEIILQTANSFNEYNGIKVNKEKLKLIIINSSETKDNTNITYGNNSTQIFPLRKKEFTRFLGVWIGEEDNKNFVKSQINDEIEKAYNVMNRAPIDFGKYRTDRSVLPIGSVFLIKFTETDISVFYRSVSVFRFSVSVL